MIDNILSEDELKQAREEANEQGLTPTAYIMSIGVQTWRNQNDTITTEKNTTKTTKELNWGDPMEALKAGLDGSRSKRLSRLITKLDEEFGCETIADACIYSVDEMQDINGVGEGSTKEFVRVLKEHGFIDSEDQLGFIDTPEDARTKTVPSDNLDQDPKDDIEPEDEEVSEPEQPGVDNPILELDPVFENISKAVSLYAEMEDVDEEQAKKVVQDAASDIGWQKDGDQHGQLIEAVGYSVSATDRQLNEIKNTSSPRKASDKAQVMHGKPLESLNYREAEELIVALEQEQKQEESADPGAADIEGVL